jgi:DNA-3-methyladenine glycosylase I
MKIRKSCEWPSNDELMLKYHDEEWGVPLHDDRKLFEFIILDAFQAGQAGRLYFIKGKILRKHLIILMQIRLRNIKKQR